MIEAVPATEKHAIDLASNLSELDRKECEIYTPDITPEQSLMTGLGFSRDATALIEDGRVLAIWGVVECEDEIESFGGPWLLSADPSSYSLAATRALLRHTRASIDRWHKWYDVLEGFSWAEARDHHRLLMKLGFEFSGVQTVGSNGDDIPPTVLFARSKGRHKEGLKYYV